MKVILGENGPAVAGLPDGNIVLFFANTPRGYCIVFGLQERCLSPEDNIEIGSSASIAFGEMGRDMHVQKVQHGHKYAQGGGMVEFGDTVPCDREKVFFRTPHSGKPCTLNGHPIEEVYTVL